ncbi:MAG: hypothetical protein R3F44_09655 [Candidatus Competibacteraceae bacterium]
MSSATRLPLMSVVGALFCTVPSFAIHLRGGIQYVVHVGGIVREHFGVDLDIAAMAFFGFGGDAAAVEHDKVRAVDRDVAAVTLFITEHGRRDGTVVKQFKMAGVDDDVATSCAKRTGPNSATTGNGEVGCGNCGVAGVMVIPVASVDRLEPPVIVTPSLAFTIMSPPFPASIVSISERKEGCWQRFDCPQLKLIVPD